MLRISLDDYYRNRDEIWPRGPTAGLDLETHQYHRQPQLFRRDLSALLRREAVRLPSLTS
ncbi:MAG: hypothetical protein ACLU9S_24780 [Oscillospiraceae bacterium]